MKKSLATKKINELQKRMSVKTDRELVGIVYVKDEQYTPQAIEIAQMILAERKLKEKTLKKHQKAVKRQVRLAALREKKEAESGEGILPSVLFEIFF